MSDVITWKSMEELDAEWAQTLEKQRRRAEKQYSAALAREEKFWSAVKRGKGCWEWQGSRNSAGYGLFSLGFRMVGAHRVSISLHKRLGALPWGLYDCVCHRCDNPPCVRPGHLFIGNQRTNALDASKKGRLKGNPGPRKKPK